MKPAPQMCEVEIFCDIVSVRFSNVGTGLRAAVPGGAVEGFEIAGARKKFYPVAGRIMGADSVELVSEEVPKPKFVRYQAQRGTLRNSQGVPAESFTNEKGKE
ncbi:MAG: hypothetical protein Q4D98_00995 [Planctomycetia bacterium]|nr:hypothetical protein [Planctomycetia bacterium]